MARDTCARCASTQGRDAVENATQAVLLNEHVINGGVTVEPPTHTHTHTHTCVHEASRVGTSVASVGVTSRPSLRLRLRLRGGGCLPMRTLCTQQPRHGADVDNERASYCL